ncbi:hypothetical protein [Candidatus Halobonum tyrrellensis]|uniref:Uncharacterized protein n=1 Tax=Candidatus Halobonum tyrrellensis G22 TaxID=1324957 RepID=V4HF26_9EURY|nr:hypothetical protein [Candidatus Halobonum tyrrellensis]ESP88713.1 hypothetical protein K933_07678 [Candidatus Halobonum tyrrellensis G22]
MSRPPSPSALRRVGYALSWLRGTAVTWCLGGAYLGIVAGVSFPTVVGTVTGAFWLWARLSLGPVAGCLYFLGIGAVVMVEFTLLRRLLDGVGAVVLRPGEG